MDLTPEEHKTLIKEAISEWLDAKYSEFGKWTFHGLLATGIAWLGYFVISHGWVK
jgi:hypothetical protein